MKRPCLLLATVALASAVSACSIEQALPAPSCEDGSSALIAAQSVPTASQIFCLERLPDGWSVASMLVNQDRTIVRLDSDRAGDDAATLRFQQACDVSGAVAAPSELPAAARYDQVDRLEPGFRARRYYVFPGGCVWWTFDFDNDASATESVAIGDVVTLISRRSFNDSFRETFVDEDI
jgi:hypothetical protein